MLDQPSMEPSKAPKYAPPGRASKTLNLLPLYAGFAATGVGVALPGAVLPVLLARWHLKDGGGGGLFLLAWIGSSIGALLLSGPLWRALALGSAGVTCGAVGLALCPASLAGVLVLLYGLGLGATMTATSLLVEREASPAEAPRALIRLNLLWALGASLCPTLASPTLRTANLGLLLYPTALAFALLAAWAPMRPARFQTAPIVPPGFSLPNAAALFRAVPLRLIVLVMLTTGVEASVGGWLATYAKRGGDVLLQIVGAPTCLWAGVLLSRLFWSVCPSRWTVRTTLRCNLRSSLCVVGASALGLLFAQHGWPLLLAAAGVGLGIGPVYPLLLARVLQFRANGQIFFLAGVSSACLPWLTGLASAHFGSLRVGLFVPAAGSLIMIALSLWAPLGSETTTADYAEHEPAP